jgi:AraC-like DNA-binding protein
MLIRFFLNLILNDKIFWYHNHNYYLWIGALLWIMLFVKIVTTPDILYGYNLLQGKIKGYDKNNITFDTIWKKEADKIVLNVQDAVLKERLTDTIQDYIIEIERISLNTNLFFSIDFTIVDLANKLNIPKSHLFYVFKYHSKLSFTDFKKMIRIQKAIAMIGEGYLKTNTMEALALDVGFYSYSPFFKSFKIITGESPCEYQKIKDILPKLIKVMG